MRSLHDVRKRVCRVFLSSRPKILRKVPSLLIRKLARIKSDINLTFDALF